MMIREFPTYQALGVSFHSMTADDLVQTVAETIDADEKCVLAGHNLHSIYLYHRDEKMRRCYAGARYVFADGMPLVWSGRALGLPLRREHRNTPVDWFPKVLQLAAERGWRVFYLGSAPGVAARGAEVLRRSMPGLMIDTEHGFFDATPGSAESEALLARIRSFHPHILCVGMGMPRQEHWISDFGPRVDANVVVSLGALMDLLSGDLPLPPRWIGRAGLEWLYRLVSRPQRVWRRYLVEPWFILPIFVKEWRATRRAAAVKQREERVLQDGGGRPTPSGRSPSGPAGASVGGEPVLHDLTRDAGSSSPVP